MGFVWCSGFEVCLGLRTCLGFIFLFRDQGLFRCLGFVVCLVLGVCLGSRVCSQAVVITSKSNYQNHGTSSGQQTMLIIKAQCPKESKHACCSTWGQTDLISACSKLSCKFCRSALSTRVPKTEHSQDRLPKTYSALAANATDKSLWTEAAERRS